MINIYVKTPEIYEANAVDDDIFFVILPHVHNIYTLLHSL